MPPSGATQVAYGSVASAIGSRGNSAALSHRGLADRGPRE